MIIHLNKNKSYSKEWAKTFIPYPMFFDWAGNSYFVFMQTVEHRQIVDMDSRVTTIFRPCRKVDWHV